MSDEYEGLSEGFARLCAEADRQQRAKLRDIPDRMPKNWVEMSRETLYAHFLRNRPMPEISVEAVMNSVRERGVDALKQPATRARLEQWSDADKDQIRERVVRLLEQGKLPQ